MRRQRDFFNVRLEREVSSIQELDIRVWVVALWNQNNESNATGETKIAP
jgi:hypothetical protein